MACCHDRDDHKNVERFKNLILSAVFNGDEKFLQILCEAATLTRSPEPDMQGVHAVIAAFTGPFEGGTMTIGRPKRNCGQPLMTFLKRLDCLR
jgi:hypothetical protein